MWLAPESAFGQSGQLTRTCGWSPTPSAAPTSSRVSLVPAKLQVGVALEETGLLWTLQLSSQGEIREGVSVPG